VEDRLPSESAEPSRVTTPAAPGDGGRGVASQGRPARCLIVRSRGGPPRRLSLGDRIATIGRSPSADLVLADPVVSSIHARIEPLPGGAHRLVDCHSRNGTRVNDRPVAQHDLEEADRIQIGGAVLVYASEEAPLEEPPSTHSAVPAARPATVGTLIDDDTSTLTVAPDGFDLEFLEPHTLVGERAEEIAAEQRLMALYRASKTLTPLSDRVPVEPRFVKLVQDILGTPRAALLRVSPAPAPDVRPAADTREGPRPVPPVGYEVVVAEVRAPADDFDRTPPALPALREVHRTRRALVFSKARPSSGNGRIGSAVCVPVAEDGAALLVAYADAPPEWATLVADDLRLLGVLARHAAACMANQRLHESVQRSNRQLEARVAERTQELGESRRRLEALADVVRHAAEAIFTVDARGLVTSWNRAAERIFGRPAAEVEGRPVVEAIAGPDERDRVLALLEAARGGRSAVFADLSLRRADGALVDGQATFAPIAGEGGATREISAIIRDATRSKRLEAEVLQNAKLAAVGTLAAGTAHEINNVLAVIMGNAELLQQAPGLSAEGQESVATILDAARRSRDVVRHLLTFARRRGAKREPSDLVELLESTLRLLATDLGRAGAKVRRQLAAIPKVPCDPGQISLIILNLLKNARDAIAAKGGGDIVASIRRRLPDAGGGPPFAVLEVRDTGIGIPHEVQKRVFEPFFTTKEVGLGTGLGLSTAYGIALNHGGKVEFESEPGKGSTFRLLLPLDRAEVEEEPVGDLGGTDSDKLPLAPAPQLHVLVCDDDPGVRSTLCAMIRRLGHHATVVTHGQEAIQATEAARFDLVLLDHGMAGLDGVATRAEILKRNPEQRIILITGNADAEDLASRNEIPPEGMLRKPFSFREIAERVMRLSAPRPG
jgi:two-component system NtrC family sensor kinase